MLGIFAVVSSQAFIAVDGPCPSSSLTNEDCRSAHDLIQAQHYVDVGTSAAECQIEYYVDDVGVPQTRVGGLGLENAVSICEGQGLETQQKILRNKQTRIVAVSLCDDNKQLESSECLKGAANPVTDGAVLTGGVEGCFSIGGTRFWAEGQSDISSAKPCFRRHNDPVPIPRAQAIGRPDLGCIPVTVAVSVCKDALYWLKVDRPDIFASAVAVNESLRLSLRKECCTDNTAKCKACRVGMTKSAYCAEVGCPVDGAPGALTIFLCYVGVLGVVLIAVIVGFKPKRV